MTVRLPDMKVARLPLCLEDTHFHKVLSYAIGGTNSLRDIQSKASNPDVKSSISMTNIINMHCDSS